MGRVPRAPLRPAADAAQDAERGLVRQEERDGLLRLLRRAAGPEPGRRERRSTNRSRRRAARARGGPPRHREKAAAQGKLPVRERLALLLDEGSFAEESLLANWDQEGLGADGVVTGIGEVDGRPVAVMANDPTVKAGSWGPKTVEKIIRIQERALSLRDTDGLPRRLGGRADHRPGPDVPRPARRGAHLPQRGQALGARAAGLRAVRAERRRRRLHPGVLRRRDHARRQRVDVPRLAADGRDGDRREGHARGDGRRADAHRRVGLRAHARQDRRGGHRRWRAATSATSRRTGEQQPPVAPRRSRPRRRRRSREIVPEDENKQFDMRAADRHARRRRLAARDPPALGQGADRRLRPARRARRRHRRQPAQAEGRRAVRRLAPTRPRASSGRATRSTSRCCSSPTCRAS